MAQSYKELLVWQKSMELMIEIYGLVKFLPKYETYGLSDQMRRASVSIPSNIAEGYGRSSPAELIRFLYFARGSQCELETQLQACVLLKYLNESEIQSALSLCEEIGKMLNSFIKKLKISH